MECEYPSIAVNCSLELPVEFKLTVPYRPPPEPLTLPKGEFHTQ